LVDRISEHHLQALLEQKRKLLTRKGPPPAEDPAP
jgi:hypothetical protein